MPDTGIRLPREILGYAEVLVEARTWRPGVLVHRRRTTVINETYRAIGVDGRAATFKRQVVTPACSPKPAADPGPVYTECSAGFADAQGALACTAKQCFPSGRVARR